MHPEEIRLPKDLAAHRIFQRFPFLRAPEEILVLLDKLEIPQ